MFSPWPLPFLCLFCNPTTAVSVFDIRHNSTFHRHQLAHQLCLCLFLFLRCLLRLLLTACLPFRLALLLRQLSTFLHFLSLPTTLYLTFSSSPHRHTPHATLFLFLLLLPHCFRLDTLASPHRHSLPTPSAPLSNVNICPLRRIRLVAGRVAHFNQTFLPLWKVVSLVPGKASIRVRTS